MEIIRTAVAMRGRAEALRRQGRRLVLVPTMGGLHRGHLSLIDTALKYGDHVTVSIFVNPTQFGEGEDFESYPRDFNNDCAILRRGGITDTVFAPTVLELYPNGQDQQSIWVKSEKLTRHLCGLHRPGHFTGVLTVVTKLFACCNPHAALFGQKDAQQYYMLRRLSEDLLLGVDIIGCETVREHDGLAFSSRNVYLNTEERKQSVVLYQGVMAARKAITSGERDASAIMQLIRQAIQKAPEARLECAEVVRVRDLQPVRKISPGEEILAAVAVYFGKTRLIDNVILRAPLSL